MNRRQFLSAIAASVPGVLLIATTHTDARAEEARYRGNAETKVFHRVGCRYFGCGECTKTFSTRDAAINAGYRACGVCKP